MNVLRNVARAHRRLGLPFVDLSEVAKAANALTFRESILSPEKRTVASERYRFFHQ